MPKINYVEKYEKEYAHILEGKIAFDKAFKEYALAACKYNQYRKAMLNPDPYKCPNKYVDSSWVTEKPVAPDVSQQAKYELMTRPQDMTTSDIMEYYGVEEYIPSVFINISPNWKGVVITENMIQTFKNTIEDYFRNVGGMERYSKLDYVLECGKEGNFLHAHIVLKINKIHMKSVITHLNKNNHARDLRRIWNKNCSIFEGMEGMGGLLEGRHSITKNVIRIVDMEIDKLNYLDEEKKPEAHKNALHTLLPVRHSEVLGIN